MKSLLILQQNKVRVLVRHFIDRKLIIVIKVTSIQDLMMTTEDCGVYYIFSKVHCDFMRIFTAERAIKHVWEL
jgi:hypothetical protein